MFFVACGCLGQTALDYPTQVKRGPFFDPRTYLSGSITNGIQEALNAASAVGGGTVLIAPGTYNLTHSLIVPSYVTLSGSGRGQTVLFIPNNAFTNTTAWQAYGYNPSGVVIAAPVGGTDVTIKALTINMNGANQSSPPNGSYGIEFVNVTYSRITDTEVNNGPILTSGNTFLPYGINGNSANNLVDSNFVYNLPCSATASGSAGFIVGGISNKISFNYVSNGCNTAFIAGGQDNLFEGNTFELASSVVPAASQAFASDNGIGARFVNNSCLGNGSSPACFSVTTDGASPNASDTTFVGNIARNCGQGYQFESFYATAQNIIVSGGSVVNCVTPLYTYGTIPNFSVSNVLGLYSGGLASLALTNGANENIAIGDAGSFRTSSTSGPTGAFSIGGFAGGFNARELTVINNSGQTMTVNNSDTASSAANRICTTTGGNYTAVRAIATFIYSSADSCWWMKAAN